MSVSISASSGRRVLASAAATAFAGVTLASLMMVPAQAAPTFYATEITAPIDPVGDPLCTVAGDTHQREAGVPNAAIVELVVEGPLTGQKACGAGRAYKIGKYWFAASDDTVDRGPTYNKKNNQQVRVVARVKGGVAVADKYTNRKRTGTTMKKDDVGYHLDATWTAGAIPGTLTIGGYSFNGSSAEADPGIAAGKAVTVQFTTTDPAVG